MLRGLTIRNGSVWPTLFLLNVSAALKGTHNYILLVGSCFRKGGHSETQTELKV